MTMKKSDTIYVQTVTKGKEGVKINRQKYEIIYEAIMKVLQETDQIPFKDLAPAVKQKLKEPFDGSISWYTTTVKLDMERRRIIERNPDVAPQQLRLISKKRK